MMPDLYQFRQKQFRQKIWAIPVIAAVAFTASLVYNHFVTLHNSQRLVLVKEVNYPLLERMQRLDGLLKQIQQTFIDAVVTERGVELKKADELAQQFIAISRQMEVIDKEDQNILLIRSAFSEYYKSAEEISVLLLQGRRVDSKMSDAVVQMGERLRILQDRIATFKKRSYQTFITNLDKADYDSRRALWVGLAAFVISVCFFGIFSFLIHRLSEALRRNLDELHILNEKLEEMVQVRTEELRTKNRELEAFVYTVSHDLKAPVVSLQGMASVLAEDYENQLDDQGRHYLQRVIANATQMEGLIQNLLDLSRIGSIAYTPEVVNTEDVVREVLEQLESQINDQQIKVNIGSPLPKIWFNRMRLHQVFSNLIGNAVKFMGKNPAPCIEIGSTRTRDKIQFYVKDNGIGIEQAFHEKIFEVFRQLKEIEAEGTGIGLSIVKKIVESYGGRIWVDSEKEKGTTFYFTTPSAPDDLLVSSEDHQYTAGGAGSDRR
jgi:signal transduction histidine kinase